MKRLVVLLLFLGTGLSLSAQDLSLKQAIEWALENAYTLQIAQKNVDIARNNNNKAEAGAYPQLSFNIGSQNTFSNINNPTSFLNGAKLLNAGATPSLDLSWTLYDGGKVRINQQRLALLEQQSSQNLRNQTESLIQQVMRAYWNAAIQQNRLQMLGQVLDLSRDKIQYIAARREYGQATEFDWMQIQDAYLNDSIQWTLQKNNYRIALENLALNMGFEPDSSLSNLRLTDALSFDLPQYSYEPLAQELLSNNQQLKSQRIVEELATVDLRLQQSNQQPRLLLNSSISEQLTLAQINGRQPQIPNDWRFGNTFAFNVGFSFTYTIYNGGRIQRSIQNAMIRQQINSLQRKDLERQLLRQLRIALERYENQRQILALTQQLIKNAERNLSIGEERFKSGVLNFFDFRTIQINYIRSLNTLEDAFLNVKNAEIELFLALGKLVQTE